MRVKIDKVSIPGMSTVGYGFGTNDDGQRVRFVGDHRPMRYIGEAIEAATSEDELPEDVLEEWQIIEVVDG